MRDREWNAYLASADGTVLATPRGTTISVPRKKNFAPFDPAIEAEANTWLSLWADKDGVSLKETLADVQDVELIVRTMDNVFARATGKESDKALVARLHRDIGAFRELASSKLDLATANVIQHADEHSNTRNELLLAYDTGDIQFCMWINLSKNPRVKTIEFGDLGIAIDIPKALALSSVAVRIMHFRLIS